MFPLTVYKLLVGHPPSIPPYASFAIKKQTFLCLFLTFILVFSCLVAFVGTRQIQTQLMLHQIDLDDSSMAFQVNKAAFSLPSILHCLHTGTEVQKMSPQLAILK